MSWERRLDKLGQEFAELKRLVKQLLTQAPVGNTSVNRGALDIHSVEGLRVFGTQIVVGVLDVIGKISIRGLGILEVLSLIDLRGSMRVRGGGDITLDGGKIETGNIRIENGMIYVGDSIVIDSATNSIRVGDSLVIDGASSEIRISDMVITEENGGSLAAPLSIVVNTPLLDLLGGLHVPQGAIFEGSITASGLLPISYTAAGKTVEFIDTIVVDSQGRFRIITG